MTADEHLKVIAGDLIIQIALWKAEIDTLKARIAALEAAAAAAAVTPQPDPSAHLGATDA